VNKAACHFLQVCLTQLKYKFKISTKHIQILNPLCTDYDAIILEYTNLQNMLKRFVDDDEPKPFFNDTTGLNLKG